MYAAQSTESLLRRWGAGALVAGAVMVALSCHDYAEAGRFRERAASAVGEVVDLEPYEGSDGDHLVRLVVRFRAAGTAHTVRSRGGYPAARPSAARLARDVGGWHLWMFAVGGAVFACAGLAALVNGRRDR